MRKPNDFKLSRQPKELKLCRETLYNLEAADLRRWAGGQIILSISGAVRCFQTCHTC